MSLVRAAWERRPEGPAYLLPSVTLLYLAGQCAFFGTHLPSLDPRNSEDFPEFLWFPDLSPPAVISSERNPTDQEVRPSLEKLFLLAILNLAAAQVKNFYVFGCGWWYDREIALLPPLCEYRERLRERLPGNSASGPHSSRRVQAPSRP